MRPTSEARPSSMPLKAAPARPISSSPVSRAHGEVAAAPASATATMPSSGRRTLWMMRRAIRSAATMPARPSSTPMMVPSRAVSSALATSALAQLVDAALDLERRLVLRPDQGVDLGQAGDDLVAVAALDGREELVLQRLVVDLVALLGLGEDRLDLLVVDGLDDRVGRVADGVGAVEVLEGLLVAGRGVVGLRVALEQRRLHLLAGGDRGVDPLLGALPRRLRAGGQHQRRPHRERRRRRRRVRSRR